MAWALATLSLAGALAAPGVTGLVGADAGPVPARLVAAGDNPERFKSEAAFAHLCGVALIPASAGKTVRHRLRRRGTRAANRALSLLAIGRPGWDARTPAYAAKRTRDGTTKPESIRCVKRSIAREVFKTLPASLT